MINKNNSTRLVVCAVLTYGMCFNSAMASPEENYLNLAEKLVALRGEVSDLSNELQMLRDEHKLEMRGLIAQKNEIDANMKQEDVALIRLKDDLITNKKLISDIGSDKETIKEALLSETEKLRSYVVSGIPFKVKDRLNSIDTYEKNLETGVLSSHKAANTLWSLIEDELKLARDNGVYRQSISINDKEHLAHVAKIGMVLMYFKVSDDEYGYFKKNGNTWVAVHTEDSRDVNQIKKLFSSLEKQVRVGYFELPNTL